MNRHVSLLARRSRLFVSVSTPGRCLTVDRFRSEDDWRRFQSEHRAAYVELDARSEALTIAEHELVGGGSADPGMRSEQGG